VRGHQLSLISLGKRPLRPHSNLCNNAPENDSELVSQVYEELRKLAGGQLRMQVASHTLQPTALVNEAWLKLAANPDLRFENRHAFLALASRAMRQVLIDHARGKQRDKRGDGWQRVTLSGLDAPGGENDVDLLALDDALEELAQLNPERVRLIELRFFGGLTETEAGEALGISRREASRQWRSARAWLQIRLDAAADSNHAAEEDE
jgi:RNA polymerase sigma-70 factor (ECF subfamily)